MDKKSENIQEPSYRKSNLIFALWWILFLFGLILMFVFLSDANMSSEWKSATLEFFLLVEVVIIIAAIESYMNKLTVWNNWVILESWILLKHKTEIPYKKINTISMHSIFWLWTLEIKTWSDEIIRYKYLAKYDEVEKLIKQHMENKE